jgi:hypothetical protein
VGGSENDLDDDGVTGIEKIVDTVVAMGGEWQTRRVFCALLLLLQRVVRGILLCALL